MFERRSAQIWYALAELPTLTDDQWRLVVEEAGAGVGDRELLRLLFDRPDRSNGDRQWLLSTVSVQVLDRVLASPVATAEHVCLVLARDRLQTGVNAGYRRAGVGAFAVVEGLVRHPRAASDVQLSGLAVDAVGGLTPDQALVILGRWPSGTPVHEMLLWRLLELAAGRGCVLDVGDGTADRPVSVRWAPLQRLLQSQPLQVQVQAARRHLSVQAVLLEFGVELDRTVLDACVPVLADPRLGASDPLSLSARLATLRRWMRRHRTLADHARAALASAVSDAARAMDDPKHWSLAAELTSLGDPDVLGDAVGRIGGHLHTLALSGGGGQLTALDPVWGRARLALRILAACPSTPDTALADILPVAPPFALDDIAKARPQLQQACAAETLARTGFFHVVPVPDVPVKVANDEELAETGSPAAAIASYLKYLPTASRAVANRLAAALLRSRYADATVLSALPAEVVTRSPWRAGLAAAMLAEACGQDRKRWNMLNQAQIHDLTFGGLLAELREYTPAAPGSGLAGYRFCHACLLTTPHQWKDPGNDSVVTSQVEHNSGWMTCQLCWHSAASAPLLAADAFFDCPCCMQITTHPGGAAVLQCGRCGSLYLSPYLPEEFRPRVDHVLNRQRPTDEAFRRAFKDNEPFSS